MYVRGLLGALETLSASQRVFLSVVSTPSVFKDDDAGYLMWIATHPEGFVLNANRTPNAAYVVLHRAGCHTISHTPATGRFWTSSYLKACSDSRLEIERWVHAQTGTAPSSCGLCHP